MEWLQMHKPYKNNDHLLSYQPIENHDNWMYLLEIAAIQSTNMHNWFLAYQLN